MMRHIVVTTPKSESANSAKEAEQCIKNGGGFYFRTFKKCPKDLDIGSHIFYVEDGYVRGFAIVNEIIYGNMRCSTTKRDWGDGYHAVMSADSWKWIEPIPMRGFQGWRYLPDEISGHVKIVGNWLDKKPKTKNPFVKS